MLHTRGATVIAGCVIALALIGSISFFAVLDLPFWLTKSEWLMPHMYHGRARVFWVRSYGDPIDVVSYHDPVHFRLSVRPPGSEPAPCRGSYPMPPMLNTDVPITIGTVWGVDDFGMNYSQRFTMPGDPNASARIAFVRVPIWLIGALLLLIPIRTALFGPIRFRRRIRRNLCGYCGYDLTGLPKPRCPECGKAT